jgi:hypothetical protein
MNHREHKGHREEGREERVYTANVLCVFPYSISFFFLCVLCALCGSSTRAEPIKFSRDVLPILSDKCFSCHGPDEKGRKAGLRLDQREAALENDVIVPGKSADSELVKRIVSHDPNEIMPPVKSNRQLTTGQITTLKKWIDEGAVWGRHWAFEAPQKSALPQTKNKKWARSEIDHFILARLEKDGLLPAPEASRETLIRRVTLDLTGLSPTPEEVDAFLADNTPDAYEKVVDRLLASPRFGERMVWDWLDAARYADTNGYQGDPTRSMYYWRDWGVEALNQNKPFDQWTIEQIAGDLLEKPTQAQLIATGFHRNHMINGEGGRIAEESRVDYVNDRVETTGTVWMGLTVGCARCHDHKFDPISQKEYYGLYAYFNSIEESGANDAGGLANPLLSLANDEQNQKLNELREVENKTNKARDAIEKQLRENQANWETSLRDADGKFAVPVWQTLTPETLQSVNGTELKKLDDSSILAQGVSPDKDDYTFTFAALPDVLTSLKLEVLPDDSLINKGPGRADNGNFVLNEIEVKIGDKKVSLDALAADFSQQGWAVAGAVDGKLDSGWAVMPTFGKPLSAVFGLRSPIQNQNLSVKLSFQFGKQHTLGRFRLSATTAPVALLRPPPDDIRALLEKPLETRSDADKKKLFEFARDGNASYLTAKAEADNARTARDGFEKSLPRTMVMRERATPRDSFILVRGQYDKYGDKVLPNVPSTLPPLPKEAPPNRLALARWIVSKENPLTARVTVNRFWQAVFGVGLVKTSEDFGVQGERPSHPELLDWLAVDFQESGWDVKRLIKQMATSAAYRQSSKIPPNMAERDPENRLMARGPRYRLPSWVIRDQALFASGLLVEKRGGPPVKGYQPPGVWEDATFNTISYKQDKGEALYRRSLYQFWRRIVGPTVFFDVSARQTCTVRTGRTNTPLHSLITFNDVTYVEAARALAQSVLQQKTAPAERLALIYRLLLARKPSAKEQTILLSTLEKLRADFTKNPDAARKLLTTGESPRDEKLDAVDHAAWTALCNMIMNLDETLSKE